MQLVKTAIFLIEQYGGVQANSYICSQKRKETERKLQLYMLSDTMLCRV